MKKETLDILDIDQKATVVSIDAESPIYRRMLDLGFVKGTVVECVGKSPSGDPAAYLVRGAVIAIRRENARKIYIDVEEETELLPGREERWD
jgi:Fe2+ transport system protein FeoA